MSQLLVFKHVSYEGPAAISDWATLAGFELIEHNWYETPDAPVSLPDFLIVMGGPMNIDDKAEFPWLKLEKDYIREAIAADIPVLGICLGAQLIAAALGRQVFPNSHQELGWLPLSLTEEAKRHAVLSTFPDHLCVFHWHGDTFELPEGATPLGSTPGCSNQGFAVGKCIGLQFHLEIDQPVLRKLISGNYLPNWNGTYVSKPDDILAHSAHHQPTCKNILFRLLDRWSSF